MAADDLAIIDNGSGVNEESTRARYTKARDIIDWNR
jgi:hypothetical protein